MEKLFLSEGNFQPLPSPKVTDCKVKYSGDLSSWFGVTGYIFSPGFNLCDEWEVLSLAQNGSNFHLAAAERGRDEQL